MPPRDPLHLPRKVYRLRALGLAMGALAIAAVFYERGAASALWTAVAVNGLLWPHLAWWHARSSADPHRAERINLIIDSALGGVWVALMAFSLLPSVLVVSMLTMDKVGWGPKFLVRSSLAMAAACLLTTLLARPGFNPHTSMIQIVGALPLMVAYPIAVALTVNRSGRLATEKRKAVEQTAALQEQLAHIARVGTLGEMAAGLAHELNQPLTAIHLDANAALALGGQDASSHASWDDTRESLERISEQAIRAGDIVRRMRNFARRGEVKHERLAVGPLVHEVLALLDHDLRHNDVQTTLDLPADLPDIVADRIAVQQVLVNLVRNAVEAMSAPVITTRRLAIRAQTSGPDVRVSVGDTGGGVDPAVAERLFHPFQSTKSTGMGLGLSICQSLVEAHGGRAGAGPHPDGGALFFFEIPAAT